MSCMALAWRRSKFLRNHLTGRHVLALQNLDKAYYPKFSGTRVFSTNCNTNKDQYITTSPPKDLIGITAVKVFRSSYYREKLENLKENFSSKMEGAKLMGAALKINMRLLEKIVCGTSLSSRERMQLIRTTADMFIIVPAAARVLLPVLDSAFPLLLRLFPNILSSSSISKMEEKRAIESRTRQQDKVKELYWLPAAVVIFAMAVIEFLLPKLGPSTFGDKIKEQETMRRKLKAKIAYVKFLQDTTAEMVKQILSSRSGDTKQTAEELDEFIDKVKRGSTISSKEIMGFAKLFNNQLTVDNISRSRLVNICKHLGITAHGADAYLRFMVQERLKWLDEDDILIQALGVECLSEAQLREDCRERGMLEPHSMEEMRLQLSNWLNLSLNHAVPSAILILSRPFAVSKRLKSEEIVLDTLCSLPDEVVNTLGISLPFNDCAKQRRRKLQHLEMQDALIKEEQTEQKVAEQDKAVGVKAVGVEARLRILGRSFAASIVASASTVRKEREEFLRLVNRKITFYKCESGEEANDKQDARVDVSDVVPSGILDYVNNMLQSLEKQLDDVDSKIGNNWQVLDRDYDGRFSQVRDSDGRFSQEVEDAALYLEDTIDNEEIQELVKDLSKDKVHELRFSCCFSINMSERKLQIDNLSIHGIWEGNIVKGKVVHIKNTKEEIKQQMETAKDLLKQLAMDYPNIRSKMDTHWKCTKPTRSPESLWLHEICKHSGNHGSMDYTYWIRAIQVANQFFYDDGRCKLMDVMKEEGYTSGKFRCEDFQADISRRIGKSISTIYRKKLDGKIYLDEIGILFDDSYNMVNYPETKSTFHEFVMERFEPEDSFIIRIQKLFKTIML